MNEERGSGRFVLEPRAWLAAIIDSSEDAIVSKTLDGTITSWNRAAERMFGYSAEEAIGASIWLIIPPDRRAEEERALASIRRGEAVDPFETERVRKDGARVHVSLTISPVKDANGRILGASKIARDIGERRRAEEERARLLQEAQQSNRAKDEFLAMLGHELRNPLGAIMSAFQVLEQVPLDDRVARRACAVGARQGRHLASLLDDLLDVGRVMTGKILIRAEPLDLAEAVRTHVAALRAAGELEAHHLSVEASDVTVHADPVRLEQIVANLVGNALRYTERGGNVRVVVERAGADAVLRVEDDGIGIVRELLPHVFDLFFQGDRRARGEGGLGVGLALVHRLVELQGGSIEASSEGPGRGSRFVVRLPAHDAAAPRSEEPSRPGSAARACRILVVEDNDDVREMLRAVLERRGHEVYEAADGRAGVEAAVRLSPELVLLDVGLPELDGYEAARRIRAELGHGIFLVAVTGYGSKLDRRRTMHAGFDDHLRKPVDVRALEAILAELSGREHE